MYTQFCIFETQDKFWRENFKFRFKNGIFYDFPGRIVDEFTVIFLKAIRIASKFRSFFPPLFWSFVIPRLDSL